MFLRDVLRRKGDAVVTVPPEATVGQMLAMLTEHNVGALVVSSDGARLDGIVSERDVVRALHGYGAAVLDAPVTEIMTVEVTVARPEDSVESLMRVMTEHRIRHVPVVVDGTLAGIVSIGDVVNHRVEELALEARTLQDYLHTGR